jgi:hypothetical protein
MSKFYGVYNQDGTRYIQGLLSEHVVDSFIATVDPEDIVGIYTEEEEPGIIAESYTIDQAFEEIELEHE